MAETDRLHDGKDLSFQRLSLSIPVESKNYKIINIFLKKVCNLPDSNVLRDGASTQGPKTDEQNLLNEEEVAQQTARDSVPSKSSELLPNIVFPKDIWLIDNLSIKDIQIKTSILGDIVKMINTELLGEKDLSSIDTAMKYYVKLLVAYKVYEMPSRTNSLYTPPDLSLKEEEDEDAQPALNPAASYSSARSQSVPNIHNPGLVKRISGMSRERDLFNSSKKRFLTLLGLESYSDVSVNEEKPNFMTKSRIYNKLKKHRDLSSSINSNSSSSSYSNRSSIMTTSTVNSNNSRRRASSSVPTDINESRLIASRQNSQTAILTLEQRAENRRSKHEYYIQLCNLLDACNKMISFMNHNATHSSNVLISNTKLVKFMDFIKTKVWKFIVIDICQMILDYGEFKISENSLAQ